MSAELNSHYCQEGNIRWCSRCTCPSSTALPLVFDDDGICSACRVQERLQHVDWQRGLDRLRAIVDEYRSASGYDIVIPVSGGKDSYYQTHIAVKVLGLKPLLVTYHGNNYLTEGERNLARMREVFDCDHVVIRPGVSVLKKLNRIAFKLHGDMNWHNHAGIETVPCQVAIRYGIPLVLWGEHGGLDMSGMFEIQDQVEFTKKFRLEHALHGYDWSDFTDSGLEHLGRSELAEGLAEKDLACYRYPSDDEVLEVGLRGIYLGNFMPWDANLHARQMIELYDWMPASEPFERTYRRISNLDDMHENGVHDYLKFIKFGYGRGTDHSSKDIRHGHMSRAQGVEYVLKYDHVKPTKDLRRWLDYIGMDLDEFAIIADTFRDRRVWRMIDRQWVKDDIDGQARSYGSAAVM